MEKKERAKRRPGMYFSTQQKHTIVKVFLEGGKSKQAIWKEFTGSHRECGKILKFMRQLGYIDDSVEISELQNMRFRSGLTSTAGLKFHLLIIGWFLWH